jgi:hypothetical protein
MKTAMHLNMDLAGIPVPLLVPLCTVILFVSVPHCAKVEIKCKHLEILQLLGTVHPMQPCSTASENGLKIRRRQLHGGDGDSK